jgi:hypothetical protein
MLHRNNRPPKHRMKPLRLPWMQKQTSQPPAQPQDQEDEPVEDQPPAAPDMVTQKPEDKPAPNDTQETVKIRVDGQEIEVPKDRLVSLAQQGVDYTRKTQALAEERRQIEAWQAVINRVQTDPAFAQRFQGLFVEQPSQQPQAQAQQETPPEDPVERLKWEITREAVAQARQELLGQVKPVAEQQAAVQHALRLQSLKSELMRDPDYPEAMNLVRNYVAGQPQAFQHRIYTELDQNPNAFLEVYEKARDHLTAMRQAATQQQRPTPAPQPAPEPPTPTPTLERKVTPRDVPKLENAGTGVQQANETSARAKSFRQLQAKIRSGESRDADIGRLLELSGAVRRMVDR